MSEWCKLPRCTEFFLLSSNKSHILSIRCGISLRGAFIGSFASICGVYSRAAFNRTNTVYYLFHIIIDRLFVMLFFILATQKHL